MDIRGSFEWFFGVVEDRNDPLQLGRVRVRAMGYHSGDAVNDLPVKQLHQQHNQVLGIHRQD